MEYSRQEYWVGSLSLLQGIFPTQGLNPGLLHFRWTLYQLSHKGSPRILEWVAYPFSSVSSWRGSWTGISCIAGRFFTNWAVREPWGGRVGHHRVDLSKQLQASLIQKSCASSSHGVSHWSPLPAPFNTLPGCSDLSLACLFPWLK